MVTGSQQLTDDYDQLTSTLELYPSIIIVATEGNPPDNYEIEYNLKGYTKQSNGSVEIGSTHRIRISLPFGYPHFAPTVKPVTPLFHPDIDPAAIRIADRWQQNPSLSDLVLYIGEMISGNVFTEEDPFDKEAAEWYRENIRSLPLDSLNIADIVDVDDNLDSLVEDTFASLGLEDDEFLAPEKEIDESDIQHIRTLISQKNIFTAQKQLAEFPDHAVINDRETIEQKLANAFRKSDQLIKLAEELEGLGKFDEASEVVDNLFQIAADLPGSEDMRSRIQQALLMSKQMDSDLGITTDDFPAQEERIEVAPVPPPPSTPDVRKKKATRPKPQFNIPFKFILTVSVILAVCIASISLYFKDQNILSSSQANILKSQILIDKHQFDEAKESLDAAQTALESLTLLFFRKNGLEQEILSLINSKILQEGLKGKILYQGEYIDADKATALRELSVLTKQAQSLAEQGKVTDALTIYQQALRYAEKNDLESRQDAIAEAIQPLKLSLTLGLAEQAEQASNWKEAAETYRQALRLSGDLSDAETANDITTRLTAATFRHELDQSKKAFTQSQWNQTITFLENAKKLIDANPEIVSHRERQDLQRLLVNSQLYRMLSTGREAYTARNFDQAINEYRNALQLLDRESDNFEGRLDKSINQIQKTVMMVQIAKIQDHVLLAESTNATQKVLKYNKDIKSLIESSQFKDDQAVMTVLAKVEDRIKKIETDLALNEKIAWLEEHFDEIFRKNYATFKNSKLINPKVRLLKEVDHKSIFNITCIEHYQGSSTRLQLKYVFDANNGDWSLYPGQ